MFDRSSISRGYGNLVDESFGVRFGVICFLNKTKACFCYLIAVAFNSSRALCAGLQSTATTYTSKKLSTGLYSEPSVSTVAPTCVALQLPKAFQFGICKYRIKSLLPIVLTTDLNGFNEVYQHAMFIELQREYNVPTLSVRFESSLFSFSEE